MCLCGNLGLLKESGQCSTLTPIIVVMGAPNGSINRYIL